MTVNDKKNTTGAVQVLCVNLEGSVGGAEQSLLLLARFMPNVVQLSVACPKGSLADRLEELHIKTHRIFSAPGRFNRAWNWFFYLAAVNLHLLWIVMKTKPQIIHANSTKSVLAAGLAKAVTGKKLIWHMRDLRCPRLWARVCGRLSSRVIAISQTVKDKLLNWGVKSECITVIHNGVVIGDPSVRVKKENQHNFMTFANLGQFVRWKKQLLFIEAAERFLQEGPKAQFVLIGDDIFGRDGQYKKELIARVRASRFASCITVVGWQNDLASWWTKIDCLVHTATTEPFGRVIIEAMAHGVPVIAAAAAGPAEIITDGKTGLLFCPDDIEGLVEAMEKMTADKELTSKLAQNAGKHILLNFQANQTAEKILTVYKELTAA